MKKILLTICFAAGSLATFAQLPTFGIKGGVNFAGQTVSVPGSNISISSGSLTTFNAGVFVDFKFGNISLQPALNYTGKGAKYTTDVTDGNGNNAGNATVKENLYYLQLPVNIVYHVPVVIGDVYFGAGPYAARGLSGSAKGTSSSGESISQPAHFGNGEDDIKAMQYGADFILGLKFKSGFLINANYDLGLSNDSPSDGAKVKSHVFGVSVGYAF